MDWFPTVDGLRIAVLTAAPSTSQLKVKASALASVASAVKLSEPPTPRVLPVAAGVCTHAGAEFFTIVHDCVVVEPPFVAVAVRTFDGLSEDEAMVCELVAPANGAPLSDHAMLQPPPPVDTVKAVVAEESAGTRTVAAEGTAPEITQVALTVTVQVHATVS